MSTSRQKLDLNRPTPIAENAKSVASDSEVSEAVECLLSGNYLILEDEYPTGTKLMTALKKRVIGDVKKENFKEYRQKRSDFHAASNRVLVPVKDHEIDLKKSPRIGWLEILYPELDEFKLTFPQVQGLNSSWQWYKKGVDYPVLNKKLHP